MKVIGGHYAKNENAQRHCQALSADQEWQIDAHEGRAQPFAPQKEGQQEERLPASNLHHEQDDDQARQDRHGEQCIVR